MTPAPTGPRSATVLAITGRILIGAGVVVVLFAGYQLWGTGIQEARAQSGLRADFEDQLAFAESRLGDLVPDATVTEPDVEEVEEVMPDADVVPPAASPTALDLDLLALLFPETGDAVARIEIPAIDVDKVVVRGVNVADLRKGPGLYPSTELPGNIGNAAIAGHRTTYGAPFNRIDDLAPGDEIVVSTVQGRFVYRVMDAADAFEGRDGDLVGTGPGHAIVRPDDTWVLGDFDDSRLTLTACHPEFSARQRIIVAAELVSTPVGLPEAISEAIAALKDGELPGEVFLPEAATTPASGEATDSATDDLFGGFDVSSVANRADLDQGLGGERDAIPVASIWLIVTILILLGAVRLARDQSGWRRFAPYLAAAVPIALTLWKCFEAADRALPAY